MVVGAVISTHAVATTPTATTGVNRAVRASAAQVSPAVGRSQAAASQFEPGSANPAAVTIGTVTAKTAAVRISSNRSPEYGAASPISRVGSRPPAKATATPARGASGATTRNISRKRSST